jgi:hypothetical protein
MINYELQIKLNNLTLIGQDDNNDLLWMGSKAEWTMAGFLIDYYEQEGKHFTEPTEE